MTDIETVAEVMEFNRDLLPPDALSEEAKAAYDVILKFLIDWKLTFTGGCTAFKNPKTWDDGYFGKNAILIVLHDGGNVGCAFSYDKMQYDIVEAMQARLKKVGLYAEQCTSWYSAIHRVEEIVADVHEEEMVDCALCSKRIAFFESFSPLVCGDDAICAECDTEVTGRQHEN